MYSLATSAAYAADSNVPSTPPQTPGDTGTVQPEYIGGVSGIWAAFKSGKFDFYLGLGFSFLMIAASMLLYRPQPQSRP